MLGIYAILKFIIMVIWIIDILNIDFMINGIHVATFLDITVPLNGLFWLLFWLFTPSIQLIRKEN